MKKFPYTNPYSRGFAFSLKKEGCFVLSLCFWKWDFTIYNGKRHVPQTYAEYAEPFVIKMEEERERRMALENEARSLRRYFNPY